MENGSIILILTIHKGDLEVGRFLLLEGKALKFKVKDQQFRVWWEEVFDPSEKGQVASYIPKLTNPLGENSNVSVNRKVKLIEDGESDYTLSSRIVMPDLEKRAHPDGFVCGKCVNWNLEEGKARYLEATHHYTNGTVAMHREVVAQMAANYKVPMFMPSNVGFCPVREELSAWETPACRDDYRPNPYPPERPKIDPNAPPVTPIGGQEAKVEVH